MNIKLSNDPSSVLDITAFGSAGTDAMEAVKSPNTPAATPASNENKSQTPTPSQVQPKQEASSEAPNKEATPAKEQVVTPPATKELFTQTPQAAEQQPTKAAEQTQSKPGPKPQARNYEELGVDASTQEILKQMSNSAYEYVAKNLKELKETRKSKEELAAKVAAGNADLPASYFDHPQAYTLDPKYTESVETYQRAQQEAAYWEEQIIKIKNGEDWEDLEVKDGKLVKVARTADAKSEREVTRYINAVERVMNDTGGKIQTLQSQANNRYQASVKDLRAREAQNLPDFNDHTESLKNPFYKSMHENMESMGFSHNPLAPTVSKLYAFAMNLVTATQEAAKKNGAAAATQEQQRKAGPTSGDMNGGAVAARANGGGKMLDIEEFNEAMNR